MIYLKLMTPINLAEEKEKFFASKTYSPQLVYDWDPVRMARYKNNEPELAPYIDALLKQDKTALEAVASKLFDVTFRAKDVALAKQIVANVPQESNDNANDVAAAITKKFRELGINYAVEIADKHGFQCRPDHKQKVLRVSKYLHLQFHSAESVANHELVHVIRAVNGVHNAIAPQPGYLPTEEGLSCLVQDNTLAASAFQHAVEYMAASLSRDVGFRDIYTFLRDHGCDAENAWLRGIRQKFGICDTSKPGGLMKSGMYFYHSQLLQELTHKELVRMFVGKIRLDQLAEYSTYSGVIPKETIEAFIATP